MNLWCLYGGRNKIFSITDSLPRSHNETGALANFLTFLVKLNIDINLIELGKEHNAYVKYCELGFDSKESDINKLRAKLEQKIKVIHLIRTDDAYKN